MKPTVQNVFDDARAHLNDVAVTGGAVWTNTRLQAHFAKAYMCLFDAMSFGSNRVRHQFYFNIAPYTSIIVPVAVGLVDLAEPELMYERDITSSVAITGTDTSTPIQVTTVAPHGLSTNATDFTVSGVSGTTAPWGRWWGTVVSSFVVQLNGSASDGSAGTGGLLTISNSKWTDVLPLDIQTDRDIGTKLLDYTWENNVFYFRGATTTRQIRIQYIASGTPPTNPNTQIAIDNCQSFLGAYTASLAAQANGWNDMSDRLLRLSFGPRMEPDASGGYLRGLLNAQVLGLQRRVTVIRQFRQSRNIPNPVWL